MLNNTPRYAFFAPVADVIRQTAANITIPAQAALAALDIQRKADGTIVTRADTEAEAFLTQRLTALLPGSQVLGEETVGDWRVSPLARDRGDVWIIDPIDGTKPYSRGEAYGIMVALRRGGAVEAAWIYYPHTRDMLFASRTDATHCMTWDANGAVVFAPVVLPRREVGWLHLSHRCAPHSEYLGVYAPVAALFSTHAPTQSIAIDTRRLLQRADLAKISVNAFTPWDNEPTRLIVERGGGSACFLQDTGGNRNGCILSSSVDLTARLLSAIQSVNPSLRSDE
jgi:fructose-1,6-bisphosphatase/inositol monophosphatase family enzyme